MLKMKSTPHHAGVHISGTYEDLDALYEAIGDLVGFDYPYKGYDLIQNRCLGLAYDLRHTMEGLSEIMMVDNGVDENLCRSRGEIYPRENVELGFTILWPELIFVVMALDDYMELSQRPYQYKKLLLIYPNPETRDQIRDRRDLAIAQLRFFQALVWDAFGKEVGKIRAGKTRKKLEEEKKHGDGLLWQDFHTQFLDELIEEFLDEMSDDRKNCLYQGVLKMIQRSEEYLTMFLQMYDYAESNGIPVEQVFRDINVDYQHIDW